MSTWKQRRQGIQSETEEVVVNYFVLCDQVITEQGTSKQSIIGIYSALMAEQFPMQANVAVALGIRVHSGDPRTLTLRFTGPSGELIFNSPALPCDWNAVKAGLDATGYAAIQIGLNLRAMPFQSPGIYTAALYCDGTLLATYPLSVMKAAPNPQG